MGTPALPRRPEMHTCLLQAAAPQGAMEHVRMPDGLAMGRLHETVGHRAMGRARAPLGRPNCAPVKLYRSLHSWTGANVCCFCIIIVFCVLIHEVGMIQAPWDHISGAQNQCSSGQAPTAAGSGAQNYGAC